jgi:hypothetical protein
MEHTSLDEAMRLACTNVGEINTVVSVRARFPNQSYHDVILISRTDFRPDPAIPVREETFGWLKGTYMSVNTADWEKVPRL